MRAILLSVAVLGLGVAPARPATVLVEAESFADVGGWTIDQQSMAAMGSPYLLAHGLGVPVADATTSVALPASGTYRVWVRTKDWVARWGAAGSPGKFRLIVDGRPIPETFGTRGECWSWHDGGTIELAEGSVELVLADLTGFEGRCDCILLTDDTEFIPPNQPRRLAAFRREALALSEKPDDVGPYDLVVVGGGVPGCCAAVSAARLGLKVALVQDRPVLGGNSSSEVRVWISGRFCVEPYPVIGEVLREMFTRPPECPGPAEDYGDDLKLRVVEAEENLDLYLGEHANRVEMNGASIRAVVSQNIRTGRRTRFAARWFVDSTGDGTVGFLAGADYDFTREGHLGTTNLWALEDTGKPAPFPECPWALDLRDKPFPTELKRLGRWYWESGFDLDTVADAEAIRDHNLRAMYGAWDALKNHRGLYPTHRLAWAAAIAGKRESRRLLGDVVLTKEDVIDGREFPDGCVGATWSIDLHYPHPKYKEACPENPFISVAEFTRFKKNPYPVPYRCLYSRNVPNLMMAGRDISVTHEALGTVRVMATGGLMGEVLGRAVAICKKYDCQPRDVYAEHLEEFKQSLDKPTKKHELAAVEFADEVGDNIAPQAEVRTSGDYEPEKYPVTNLTDLTANVYDNLGRWLSKPGKPGAPAWVELRWDSPKSLAGARIISGYFSGGQVGDPIRDFRLEVGDGAAWREISGTVIADNSTVDWQCQFAPVTTRRLRLIIDKTQIGIARLWEIAIYEADAQSNDER